MNDGAFNINGLRLKRGHSELEVHVSHLRTHVQHTLE